MTRLLVGLAAAVVFYVAIPLDEPIRPALRRPMFTSVRRHILAITTCRGLSWAAAALKSARQPYWI